MGLSANCIECDGGVAIIAYPEKMNWLKDAFRVALLERGCCVETYVLNGYKQGGLVDIIAKVMASVDRCLLVVLSSGLEYLVDRDIAHIREAYLRVVIISQINDNNSFPWVGAVRPIFSHLSFTQDSELSAYWQSNGQNCVCICGRAVSGQENNAHIKDLIDGIVDKVPLQYESSGVKLTKKARVLFYMERPFDIGGTQKYTLNLIRWLPKNVFQCGLVVPRDQVAAYDQWCSKYGVDVELVSYHSLGFHQDSTVGRIDFSFDLKGKVKAFDPEVIFTSSSGVMSAPLHMMGISFVDVNHINGGVNRSVYMWKTLHISAESQAKWFELGGDRSKSVKIINALIDRNKELDPVYDKHISRLKNNRLAFGFHQRKHDQLFSPIPLEAYKAVEDESTCFILFGGSSRYSNQAKKLELKNFYQLPTEIDDRRVMAFLNNLDIYAHGRHCGELVAYTIAEAMSFGLPVVSHIGKYNNGHVELIGRDEYVVRSVDEYAQRLIELKSDLELRKEYGEYLRYRIMVSVYSKESSLSCHYGPLLEGVMAHRHKMVYSSNMSLNVTFKSILINARMTLWYYSLILIAIGYSIPRRTMGRLLRRLIVFVSRKKAVMR